MRVMGVDVTYLTEGEYKESQQCEEGAYFIC